MSNVQLENGFTRIANEILEVIYGTNFNATQLKIVLCIIRFTYGFQRKSHTMSLSFISKATGVSKRYISDELTRLIEAKIIIITKEYTSTKSRELQFNKNYTEWVGYRTTLQQVKETTTDEEYFTTTDEEYFTTTDEEYFTTTDEEYFNQEIKKENNKEIYISIVDYLNIKANKNYKATTKKTQSLIDARLNEGFTLDDFKRVIDNKIASWKGTEWEKYLRPETLFGNKFEGYLNEKNSTKETEESLKGSNWRGSDKRL